MELETQAMANQSVTEMVVGNYVCEWFTGGKVVEGEDELVSRRFYAGMEKQTEWEIYLYPNDESNGTTGYVSLRLQLTRGWPVTVGGKIEIKILKEPERIIRDPLQFHAHFLAEEGISFPEFVLLSEIKKQNRNCIKKIGIICKLVIDEKPERKAIPYCRIVEDLKIRSEDFLTMLHGEMNNDVRVFVERGAVIPAHKFMLKARSRKFARMLRTDPAAIFTTLTFDVANELLSYIYSAKFSQCRREVIYKLAAVADEYGVNGLFDACELFLSMFPLDNPEGSDIIRLE